MTEHQQIIDALALNDEDDVMVTSKEVVGEVSADRRQVWSSRLDTLLPTDALVAVRCVGGLINYSSIYSIHKPMKHKKNVYYLCNV